MKVHANIRLAVSAAALCTVACGDPLLERQTVTRMRVLGARYEADADPERASPIADETGRVRWLITGPDGPLDVGFELFACAAQERIQGVPSCGGPPVAESRGRALEPALDLEVPAAARLLIGGTFCSIGDAAPLQQPTPALEDGDCLDPNAELELATYELDVLAGDAAADESLANRHPDLSGAELSLNDDAWAADATPCVPRGAAHRVRLALPSSAREPRSGGSSGTLETLQVSHLSTGGRFERPFTVFASGATRLELDVAWHAPDATGLDHVFFVVRDLRGGVSWISRLVCVE